MKRFLRTVPIALVVGTMVLAGCSNEAAEARGPGAGRQAAVASVSDEDDARVERGAGRLQFENPSAETSSVEVLEKCVAEGTLVYDDPEWYLETDDGLLALHLGNRSYLESLDIELEAGRQAQAIGVMEDDGLSVHSLSVGTEVLTLRDDSGRPMWAGSRGPAVSEAGTEESTGEERRGNEAAESVGRGSAGRGRGASTAGAGGKGRGQTSI